MYFGISRLGYEKCCLGSVHIACKYLLGVYRVKFCSRDGNVKVP